MATALLFASIAMASFDSDAASVPRNDPLFIRLVAAVSPARAAVLHGGDRYQSAYEVYLTNFGTTPMKVTKVTVTGRRNGAAVMTEELTGKELAGSFQSAGIKPSAYRQPMLEAGRSAVIFLFPKLDDRAPNEFDTTITVEGWGEYGGSGMVPIESLRVSGTPVAAIHPPIRGADWLAANGPSNTSVHRRAILFVDGQPKIGQRYAIDWVKLGADGKTFHGDEHDNRSYYAYDEPIYAAANGTIVEVRDGIAENIPNSGKIAAPIGMDTIAGNHIVENLGGGRFAAYAHLRPGSIKVKPGERVRAGQVLARLGNTGNSSEPHLHFQVCDAPSFVDSEGLPFAIAHFTRSQYKIDKNKTGGQALTISGARAVADQEPVEDELDSFASK